MLEEYKVQEVYACLVEINTSLNSRNVLPIQRQMGSNCYHLHVSILSVKTTYGAKARSGLRRSYRIVQVF